MNALLNALEELHDILKSVENESCATRTRSYLTRLLHKDEFNLDQNDPNHPYMRFAAPDDSEGNRLRLFPAMQEAIGGEDSDDEGDHDLQPCIDLMFETPDTGPYNKVQRILRRYMRYANEHRTASDSDLDSDSESGSDSN
jgi:hypothetical protein